MLGQEPHAAYRRAPIADWYGTLAILGSGKLLGFRNNLACVSSGAVMRQDIIEELSSILTPAGISIDRSYL